MPADGERLLGVRAASKLDSRRRSLPRPAPDTPNPPAHLRTHPSESSFFKTGLRRLNCATMAKVFLPSSDDSAIGNVIPIPARRGIEGIELRQIDRRNAPGHTIDQHPSSALPLPSRRGIFGQTVVHAEARRTTNSRSVTSCGGPIAYSFTRAVDN